MKTLNKTQVIEKAIDVQLRKMLQADLKLFRNAQSTGINQGTQKAA